MGNRCAVSRPTIVDLWVDLIWHSNSVGQPTDYTTVHNDSQRQRLRQTGRTSINWKWNLQTISVILLCIHPSGGPVYSQAACVSEWLLVGVSRRPVDPAETARDHTWAAPSSSAPAGGRFPGTPRPARPLLTPTTPTPCHPPTPTHTHTTHHCTNKRPNSAFTYNESNISSQRSTNCWQRFDSSVKLGLAPGAVTGCRKRSYFRGKHFPTSMRIRNIDHLIFNERSASKLPRLHRWVCHKLARKIYLPSILFTMAATGNRSNINSAAPQHRLQQRIFSPPAVSPTQSSKRHFGTEN